MADRIVRTYFVAVLLLIVLFSLMIAWEALTMSCSPGRNAVPCSAHRAGADDQRDNEYAQITRESFTKKLFRDQRRPLLVRFDWYSRKKTPVHVG